MQEIKSYVKRQKPSEAIQFEGGRQSASALATWAESFSDTQVRYMGVQDFLMINSGTDWSTTLYKRQWLIRENNRFISLDEEDFYNQYQELDVR